MRYKCEENDILQIVETTLLSVLHRSNNISKITVILVFSVYEK